MAIVEQQKQLEELSKEFNQVLESISKKWKLCRQDGQPKNSEENKMKAGDKYNRNGDEYLVVSPVESLKKSSLVSDVLARGDHFVVNLRTNNLTIHPQGIGNKPYRYELQFHPDRGGVVDIHCETIGEVYGIVTNGQNGVLVNTKNGNDYYISINNIEWGNLRGALDI